MLSYLHGFHAGNAADVLKHSLLIFCLDYLKKKEKPLLCADTHAGAGLYKLANREWEKGIGLLMRSAEKPPPLIDTYMQFCASCAGPDEYPGSPYIMAKMLAKGDRLVCFELHPREEETLKRSLQKAGSKAHTEVRREDGPAGLKSLLPPPSRRGLVLVDPSWEEQDEYESVPRAVQAALKRFPEGTFMVWYPLLALAPGLLPDVLFGLAGGSRCRVELRTGAAKNSPGKNSPRGMYGSGLAIFNPPWTLRPALEAALPCLARILGGAEGSWRLDYADSKP